MNQIDPVQYEAMRNATFFILAGLVDEIASMKGVTKEASLQKMRTKILGNLDAGRQMDPAREYDPIAAEIAEVARSIVGAVFDAAAIRK